MHLRFEISDFKRRENIPWGGIILPRSLEEPVKQITLLTIFSLAACGQQPEQAALDAAQQEISDGETERVSNRPTVHTFFSPAASVGLAGRTVSALEATVGAHHDVTISGAYIGLHRIVERPGCVRARVENVPFNDTFESGTLTLRWMSVTEEHPLEGDLAIQPADGEEYTVVSPHADGSLQAPIFTLPAGTLAIVNVYGTLRTDAPEGRYVMELTQLFYDRGDGMMIGITPSVYGAELRVTPQPSAPDAPTAAPTSPEVTQ